MQQTLSMSSLSHSHKPSFSATKLDCWRIKSHELHEKASARWKVIARPETQGEPLCEATRHASLTNTQEHHSSSVCVECVSALMNVTETRPSHLVIVIMASRTVLAILLTYHSLPQCLLQTQLFLHFNLFI